METIVYWLLVLGYYLLGLVAGLILVALFYPALWTFPKTVLFVWGGALNRSAVLNLIWAMMFPIILLGIGYFLLNLLTPAYDVITSRSFLVGLLGTIVITLFNGGFRRGNLSADYADFMARHSTIPEDVSPLHVLIATSVIQYCMCNYDDPHKDEKWDKVVELIKSLEFNERDQELLLKALKHARAKEDEIDLAMGLYSDHHEYVEWQRQHEIEKLEDERKEREYQDLQKLEDEEFEKQMKEWKEKEGLLEKD